MGLTNPNTIKMKKNTFCLSVTLFFSHLVFLEAQTLNHLSSYQTNIEGSAETVAYDKINKRAYFTNSSDNSFTIVDISNPEMPTLFSTIDLSTYGDGPNSIALYNDVVAVAVESNPKQDPGKVVFFDLIGTYTNSITTGALPDMLTFTPDGSTLIVANEGEPSDDYTNDPEGSITIIDLSGGVLAASAGQIGFSQ